MQHKRPGKQAGAGQHRNQKIQGEHIIPPGPLEHYHGIQVPGLEKQERVVKAMLLLRSKLEILLFLQRY